MTWLPDGNVLAALLIDTHVHHASCCAWFDSHGDRFATCAMTRRGRVLTTDSSSHLWAGTLPSHPGCAQVYDRVPVGTEGSPVRPRDLAVNATARSKTCAEQGGREQARGYKSGESIVAVADTPADKGVVQSVGQPLNVEQVCNLLFNYREAGYKPAPHSCPKD